ncbi:hypothetical protein F4677DRAFT_412023 [Hypoxylon crocopeplum]|nr:hypothetical protein F4677DRAFT_412023 [Hypoxylon crocopeplum]
MKRGMPAWPVNILDLDLFFALFDLFRIRTVLICHHSRFLDPTTTVLLLLLSSCLDIYHILLLVCRYRQIQTSLSRLSLGPTQRLEYCSGFLDAQARLTYY